MQEETQKKRNKVYILCERILFESGGQRYISLQTQAYFYKSIFYNPCNYDLYFKDSVLLMVFPKNFEEFLAVLPRELDTLIASHPLLELAHPIHTEIAATLQ